MSPLRGVPIAAAFLFACGEVATLDVSLEFSTPDIKGATKQVLLVVQLPPKDGDPCEPLWADPPAKLGEPFVRLINFPNANDLLAAGLADERYALFAYAHATQFDLFCKTVDSECSGSNVGKACRPIGGGQKACVSGERAITPLAAGCGVGSVGLETRPISIKLSPR
ncbi:MAG: hypothetical protein HYV07_27130 [Deltaproteobacteria bacterium]|nr:hypothetical protein [Deltaproteobacteria bacterium]